ncbi:Mov34/MPN/PAD-1 family protein [Psychrobium sp. 1_MG-2023]|uniref:Mov34/MPN/PAD-1 family protein n=1 Tax=Psychrobium sp. 1_MG-2023 TaxID=3062624 RepID=UPI002733CB49|nr:Mov34/MPN/PAD-1 family protein [Psychrobium sp. 1_MG-2023]MDP2560765.1 Mov34/MPN/PAD-1 family protein [Psychrobium sp. 1_MG-2023]
MILIQNGVLQALESHRQLKLKQAESGGILIGEYRGEHINIVEATEPSRGDRRSRYRFFRRSERHQTLATKAWNESGTTKTFIGDWHTHAEDHPSPSSIDTKDWRRKFQKRPMVVIIQGRISRWYGYWDGKSLLEAGIIK